MLSCREGSASSALLGGAVGTIERALPTLAGRGMTRVDYTRPLLLGYLRKHLLMTDDELYDTEERLEHFARIEGFAMGTIYIEEVETSPAAFEALVEAVNRY